MITKAEIRERADAPYAAELDDGGCERCGQGKSWLVVGPDGVGGSTSYHDEEDAQSMADALNAAYALGMQGPPFNSADEADHCACLHDGRGALTSECQEHRGVREQRTELLLALQAIVRAYDGPTVDAATAVSSHIQAARMAIKKAEGR